MDPCGMIMDMGTEARVARAQLSSDPDDWCWVRLYRAREGAAVRPGTSWGCNPVWDDAFTTEFVGPQIYLHPSENRPWTYSPFPGLHYRGAPEWYRDGLPKDARKPGETGEGCGGEIWDARVSLPLAVTIDEAQTVVLGGSAEGGSAASGAGYVGVALGGSAEGGAAVGSYAAGETALGGSAEGGAAASGAGFVGLAEGGSAEGGAAVATFASGSAGLGGSAEGGEAFAGAGYGSAGLGGSAEGGAAVATFASGSAGLGGSAEGGEAFALAGYGSAGLGGSAEGGAAVATFASGSAGLGGSAEGGLAFGSAGYGSAGQGGSAEGGEAFALVGYGSAGLGGSAEGGEALGVATLMGLLIADNYVATSETLATTNTWLELATLIRATFTLNADSDVWMICSATGRHSVASTAAQIGLWVDGSLISVSVGSHPTVNAPFSMCGQVKLHLLAGAHEVRAIYLTGAATATYFNRGFSVFTSP